MLQPRQRIRGAASCRELYCVAVCCSRVAPKSAAIAEEFSPFCEMLTAVERLNKILLRKLRGEYEGVYTQKIICFEYYSSVLQSLAVCCRVYTQTITCFAY